MLLQLLCQTTYIEPETENVLFLKPENPYSDLGRGDYNCGQNSCNCGITNPCHNCVCTCSSELLMYSFCCEKLVEKTHLTEDPGVMLENGLFLSLVAVLDVKKCLGRMTLTPLRDGVHLHFTSITLPPHFHTTTRQSNSILTVFVLICALLTPLHVVYFFCNKSFVYLNFTHSWYVFLTGAVFIFSLRRKRME